MNAQWFCRLRRMFSWDRTMRLPAVGAPKRFGPRTGHYALHAAARHAPFQDVDPVPVTAAPRLVDESEMRVRMSREQHPQRAYALPVVVDGQAGSAQGVVQYGLGRVEGCPSCWIHDVLRRIRLKGRILEEPAGTGFGWYRDTGSCVGNFEQAPWRQRVFGSVKRTPRRL